jgi:small-conductance mechanosensitive channel
MTMNTDWTGRGWVDALAAGLTALLSDFLEAVFGNRVRAPIAGGLEAVDLGVALCFVLLTWLVSRLVVALFQRLSRSSPGPGTPGQWRVEAVRKLGGPLRLMIGVYGFVFVATPMLLKLPGGEQPHLKWQVFDRIFELGVFTAFLWLCLNATQVVETLFKARAAATPGKWDNLVVPHLCRSLRVLGPVVGVIFAMPMLGLPPEFDALRSILVIGAVAYILFRAVHLGERVVLARCDITTADNLQARKVYTQVHVLSRTIHVIIAIFTMASVLMLFEEVRRFGTSILASAGVFGIILGFAAQRTIANLFAGFQLALTQPIRHDDVVIVEGEWGRIEEMTLTYVVVRIWDDRRLVVPLNYFIEQPFQNWTRNSSKILGSVFVWADYTLPISELRPVVQRLVEGCGDWDRRFWNLQITDATERAMQLRVLATASDASKAWDLRCEIREKLLDYLQKHHPQSLPKVRAVMDASSDGVESQRASTAPP